MKKYVLITALLALGTTACVKEKDNINPQAPTNTTPTPTPNTNNTDDSYIINGIADIAMGNYDKVSVPLSLEFKSGTQKNITLSVKDLPKYCKAEFTPKTGVPGFNSSLNINTFLADPGSYTITIMGTAEDGKTRIYKLTLTIADKTDCNGLIAKIVTDKFTTTEKDSSKTLHDQTMVSSTYDSSKKMTEVMLNDIYLQSDSSGQPFITYNGSLKITSDCAKRMVTIPMQRLQGRRLTTTIAYKDFDISGTGTIDPEKGTLTIDYTTKDNSSNTSNFTMTVPIKL